MTSIPGRRFLPTPPLNDALPLSQPHQYSTQTLRRRLSSISFKIHPISSPLTSWSFPRSKSMSSMRDFTRTSLRKWWDWGWSWILSRKAAFARDLEMNDNDDHEETTKALGSTYSSRGSFKFKHLFYKVRSEFRKLIRSDRVGLPQTFKYDSVNYSKNFDDGVK
uniref:Uncharacterized protein n=1 Tax=Cucumis sativus TaxID=3659 RepID=A0A0A0K1L8_CUCSA